MVRAATWLGHATVVVDLDGTRLITDPVFRKRVLHLRRDAAVATPAGLHGVLLSHLHYDHLDLPSLATLPASLPIVVPRGGARFVRGLGDAVEVEAGGTVQLGPLRVTAVEAAHDGRRRPAGPPVAALGYVICGSRTIYFAGDTDLFPGMAALAGSDLALLPVAGWGPTLGPGHLVPSRAARALALLRPAVAVPIHWGTYSALGTKANDRGPAEAFALAAETTAPEVDVRILPVGGTLPLE